MIPRAVTSLNPEEITPSEVNSVHRPIEYIFDLEQLPLASVANGSGFASFTLTGNFLTMPTVGAVFYVPSGVYKGYHTSTAVGAIIGVSFSFTSDQAYISGDSGMQVKWIDVPEIEVYAGYLSGEGYETQLPNTLVATFTPSVSPDFDVRFGINGFLKSIFEIVPPEYGISFSLFNRFRLKFDGVYDTHYQVVNSSIKTADLNSIYFGTGVPLNANESIIFECGKTVVSYLDSSGVVYTTPVNNNNVPVNLLPADNFCDGSMGEDAELVPNGTFTTNLSGWNVSGGWSQGSGKANFAGSTCLLYRSIGLIVGRVYKLSIVVTNYALSAPLEFGMDTASVNISANGTYILEYQATSSSQDIVVSSVGSGIVSVDDISVKSYFWKTQYSGDNQWSAIEYSDINDGYIVAGATLIVGQRYRAITTCVHNSITRIAGTAFTAVNSTLTSGTCARTLCGIDIVINNRWQLHGVDSLNPDPLLAGPIPTIPPDDLQFDSKANWTFQWPIYFLTDLNEQGLITAGNTYKIDFDIVCNSTPSLNFADRGTVSSTIPNTGLTSGVPGLKFVIGDEYVATSNCIVNGVTHLAGSTFVADVAALTSGTCYKKNNPLRVSFLGSTVQKYTTAGSKSIIAFYDGYDPFVKFTLADQDFNNDLVADGTDLVALSDAVVTTGYCRIKNISITKIS